MRVAVIGAGMSGLTCARELEAAGASVSVFDKGRAVGGRMATRTIDGARFDHGAQHFSVRSPEFASVIDPLRDDGLVTTWFESPSLTEPALGIEPRFVGRAGMRRVPEALSRGMDVRLGSRVRALETTGSAVSVRTGDGEAGAFDAVVCTAPVPQTVELLAASAIPIPEKVRRQTQSLGYDPCLAVLAIPSDDPGLVDGHLAAEGTVAWMADNHQKGISDAPSLTIHAGAQFSSANLELEP
ncbi:MAG: FAD-dependent oxidoreductase, partial [Acidimicrobiia bacterium]|nr:FAD-dependent oxidoreductase [Acidimicrobiia bacterium]